MKKETAVEWLSEYIRIVDKKVYADLKEMIEQAKQMEKEQIVEAHGVKESHGAEGSRNFWQQTTGEQYYKEQYERQDNKH